MPLDMEVANRTGYAESSSNKSKRRRSLKNLSSKDYVIEKKFNSAELASSPIVFNEYLFLNSSPHLPDDGQKPRSHANARERDRTHRCVMRKLAHYCFFFLLFCRFTFFTVTPTKPKISLLRYSLVSRSSK